MKYLFLQIIILICIQAILYSQDEYKLRDDQYDPRMEGIKSEKYTNVTSDRIFLL